jgi:hypothetical protein
MDRGRIADPISQRLLLLVPDIDVLPQESGETGPFDRALPIAHASRHPCLMARLQFINGKPEKIKMRIETSVT